MDHHPDRMQRGSTNAIMVLAILAAVVYSGIATEFSPAAFFAPGNGKNIARFLGGLWPPAIDPDFLNTILRLMLETTEISLIGTFLAVLMGFPLAIFAVRERGEEFSRVGLGTCAWIVHKLIFLLARGVLNLLRGIPEIMWALIFVVAVGLGPFPGVLALAFHSAGILGKLYSEVFESVDQRLIEAVRASGASDLQVLLSARLPASLPVFLSYTLFRWECNMRAATILGLVGAGGIGTQLMISMKLFRYDEVMTLIIAILALVMAVDAAGQLVRMRILDGPEVKGCKPAQDES